MLVGKNEVAMCHAIREGHRDVSHMAYFLEYILLHMPVLKRKPALEWLLKNKITGQKFLDFVKGECGGSGLELIRRLTARVERETGLRVLTAKDIA